MGTRPATVREAPARAGRLRRRRCTRRRALWATAADGTRSPDLGRAPARHAARRLGARAALRLRLVRAFDRSRRSASSRLSLLDRGFVYAIAHVRGGGEMGRAWYEDGRLEHKTNTFTDFIACAEHLVAERLHVAGAPRRARRQRRRPAHGCGREPAARSLRGDRRRGAVRRRRHDDARSRRFRSPITEWEEWGDPREPEAYARMKAYSPYDNVRAVALSGDVRHDRAQRSARAVLGAGEVGREAPCALHLGQADPVAHRDGRRARRAVGPLRRVARRGHRARRSCATRSASTRESDAELLTADGVTLEAEWSRAGRTPRRPLCCAIRIRSSAARCAASSISALFDALPALGVACLRFNFRGVEGSDGRARRGTRRTARRRSPRSTPTAECARRRPARARRAGRSAPTWRSPSPTTALAGWVGIAPPLRFRPRARTTRSAHDPRPKLLDARRARRVPRAGEIEVETAALDEHDASRSIAGASHFFVGRTDRVVDADGRVRRAVSPARPVSGYRRERARREPVRLEEGRSGARSPSATPRDRTRTWRGRRPRTHVRARRTPRLRRRASWR